MPLIQGGPPEWIWERTPYPMKYELRSSRSLDGHEVFELRLLCGLDIMRLQFFTPEELAALRETLSEKAPCDSTATTTTGG